MQFSPHKPHNVPKRFVALIPKVCTRAFGWEDKFRLLLLRFERLSQLHYAFNAFAYTMINLRHFCQG
jgi:hypothetical protein